MSPASSDPGSEDLGVPAGFGLGVLSPIAFLRVGAVLGVSLLAALALLFPLKPTRVLQGWCRLVLCLLRVKVHVEGRPDLGAQLWVANHLSWLDPLVLIALRPMGVLAKSEVSCYPVIGRAARRFGLTFVERGDSLSRATALTQLAVRLCDGDNMLLFPEGTTTRGDRLAPFYPGGLLAAFRSGSSLLPLRIDSADPRYPWVGDASLLPSLLALADGSPVEVRLSVGSVLESHDFTSEKAWIDAIRQQLQP